MSYTFSLGMVVKLTGLKYNISISVVRLHRNVYSYMYMGSWAP